MKTLVLAGSGEFTNNIVDADKYILSSIKSPKVVIIPLAAGKESDHTKWIDMGINHYKGLGVEAFGLDIKNKEDAQNKEVVDKVLEANLIYFSGGDPGYILEAIKDSYLEKVIRDQYEKGVVLAGSSAGAMIFGDFLFNIRPSISFIPSVEKALHLVNYIVTPHFNRFIQFTEMGIFKDLVIKTNKGNLIGIEEDTYLVVSNEHDCIVKGKGKVYVYKNEVKEVYKVDQVFTI